jgi:DNA-binding NtrC family response regulator
VSFESITVFPEGVLVVDDEEVVRQVIAGMLPMHGLHVQTAPDAESALELVRKQGFACVLTDKNLPGMTGIQLIAEVRQLQPYCACIVMTGYASTASAVEALRLGAIDYLEKPFPDMALVVEKLRRAIANQRGAFERGRFIEQLEQFRAELKAKAGELAQHRSALEEFNAILEQRVADATADLRRERDELAAELARKAPAERRGEAVAVRMVLMLIEELQRRPDAAALRGDLARIVRQLDAHMRTLRA